MGDLGKMPMFQVDRRARGLDDNMNGIPDQSMDDRLEAAREVAERSDCYAIGAPNRRALLSRAQVRAVLSPVKDEFFARRASGEISMFQWQCAHDAIHACAKALLHLAPGDHSPLEED